MNDHDAMEAINAVLQELFDGNITQPDALHRIAYISGTNAIDHAEAKRAKR